MSKYAVGLLSNLTVGVYEVPVYMWFQIINTTMTHCTVLNQNGWETQTMGSSQYGLCRETGVINQIKSIAGEIFIAHPLGYYQIDNKNVVLQRWDIR